ncbi:hypothetical protein PMAYCL1PPCAC_21365 [Pristionchus mayeri]|uniref:Uncharacterized protein n=1 Tax=Pristionchus mayeri TaxID=1317129 RepID=A0AAN5CVB4_9BILA|nr:hypothetical protein PMAYCL1PPCAC_21365 [Pristionchus mayeri]
MNCKKVHRTWLRSSNDNDSSMDVDFTVATERCLQRAIVQRKGKVALIPQCPWKCLHGNQDGSVDLAEFGFSRHFWHLDLVHMSEWTTFINVDGSVSFRDDYDRFLSTDANGTARTLELEDVDSSTHFNTYLWQDPAWREASIESHEVSGPHCIQSPHCWITENGA